MSKVYTVAIDTHYERGEHPGNPLGAIKIEADSPEHAVAQVRAILANTVLTAGGKVYRPRKRQRVLYRWGFRDIEGTVVASTDDKVKVAWDEPHPLYPEWVAKVLVKEIRS